MATSDPEPRAQPAPPAAQPWGGGATDRPPWEQDPEQTMRIPPVAPPPQALRGQSSSPQAPVRQPSGLASTPQTQGHQPRQFQHPPTQPPSTVGVSELAVGAPHGDAPVRRGARAVLRALSSTKHARDLEEVLAEVQVPVTTGRRIAVTSVRGGAGKTAVSALLGSVFAMRRAEPVLTVDATPEWGSLAWRLGVTSPMTLPGLAPALQTASGQNLTSVDRLLPRTSCGLRVVPGGSSANAQLARDVTRALSRLFAVAVLDCTTDMNAHVNRAVLADAHAVIVVVPATPDGVRTTVEALTRISPAELQHVVVALNELDPHGRATLKTRTAEALFSHLRLPVVTLPYDRHVGAGTVIDPARSAEPTVTAISRLAAWSLRRVRTL